MKVNNELSSLIGDEREIFKDTDPHIYTVELIESELKLDIVPVLDIPSKDGFGNLIKFNGSTMIETCPECHVRLIQEKSELDADFRILVRLCKMWRNYKNLERLSSYMIEITLIHLQKSNTISDMLTSKFLRFLNYIAETALESPIDLNNIMKPDDFKRDSVKIIDPFCGANNVASSILEQDGQREEIVKVAQESYELVKFVTDNNRVNNLDEIFGPSFRIMK